MKRVAAGQKARTSPAAEAASCSTTAAKIIQRLSTFRIASSAALPPSMAKLTGVVTVFLAIGSVAAQSSPALASTTGGIFLFRGCSARRGLAECSAALE